MKTKIALNPLTSRRAFLSSAATVAAWAVVSPRVMAADTAPGKPNSVINGVRVGCITYSYRGEINSAEDILKTLVQTGLSEVEMMGEPIRAYAGIRGGGHGRSGGPAEQTAPPTDAQREAQLAKCRELRKLYN